MSEHRTRSARRLRDGTFRELLQRELARRCAANARYSLRSFARQLDVDHSTLSQILRGKRAATPHTIRALGTALGLSGQQIESFVTRERLFAASREAIAGEMEQLTRDAMHVVSDWRHYAILELTHLDTFRPDVRWIARMLEIEADDVNVAIQRLARLGMLEMSSPGRWTDTSADLVSERHAFPRVTLAKLLHQAHLLALEAAMGIDVLPPGSNEDEEN
jgi:uncharacterized protein (TIGR02147 family)